MTRQKTNTKKTISTQLPLHVIDFLDREEKKGKKKWFIIYEALCRMYPNLKKS